MDGLYLYCQVCNNYVGGEIVVVGGRIAILKMNSLY